MRRLNHIQQVCLRKSHWDVLDHECGQVLLAIEHCEKVNQVVCGIGCWWNCRNRVKLGLECRFKLRLLLLRLVLVSLKVRLIYHLNLLLDHLRLGLCLTHVHALKKLY